MFSLMNCQVNKKETPILSKVLGLDKGPNSSLGKNIYVKKVCYHVESIFLLFFRRPGHIMEIVYLHQH